MSKGLTGCRIRLAEDRRRLESKHERKSKQRSVTMSNRWPTGVEGWFEVGLFGLLALGLSLAIQRYAPTEGALALLSGLLLGLSIVLDMVAIYKLAGSRVREC